MVLIQVNETSFWIRVELRFVVRGPRLFRLYSHKGTKINSYLIIETILVRFFFSHQYMWKTRFGLKKDRQISLTLCPSYNIEDLFLITNKRSGISVRFTYVQTQHQSYFFTRLTKELLIQDFSVFDIVGTGLLGVDESVSEHQDLTY